MSREIFRNQMKYKGNGINTPDEEQLRVINDDIEWGYVARNRTYEMKFVVKIITLNPHPLHSEI